MMKRKTKTEEALERQVNNLKNQINDTNIEIKMLHTRLSTLEQTKHMLQDAIERQRVQRIKP